MIIKVPTNLRLFIYLTALFMTLSVSLVSYTNSSFLAQIIGTDQIGLIYIASSIISLFLFLIWPSILKTIRLKTSLALLGLVSFIALTGLFIFDQVLAVGIGLFLVFYATAPLLRYSLDLYLENFSTNKITGGIRGLFLTIINTAWLISPIITGLILDGSNHYELVYGVAGLTLIPFLFLLFKLPRVEITSKLNPTSNPWAILWRPKNQLDKDLRNILGIDFILNFFYALMVIYTPLYLHQAMGFSWDQIGFIFTIMLLPFVLIQYPLGLLCDKKIGEKEIIITGLILMAFATTLIIFLPPGMVVLWAIILCLTRVGAAAVEIAKETYLFKKIKHEDSTILSLSRMLVSVSYIIGPLSVGLFLIIFDFKFLFAALGLVVLLGLYFAYNLVDTA